MQAACEVFNLTKQESHSTKGRALLLWRIVAGHSSFNNRDAEIVYQSTLDTISQAWCVHGYPVGEYVHAARCELVKNGTPPLPVSHVLENLPAPTEAPKASTVFLTETSIDPEALKILAGGIPEIWVSSTGRIPYALGDIDSAKEIADEVSEKIRRAGIKTLIVDGPVGLYTFTILYKDLKANLPDDLKIIPLSAAIEEALNESLISPRVGNSRTYFIHDSRTAFYLADESADDTVLQPALSDCEKGSGIGEVFDRPRRICEKAGCQIVESVWTKAMSRSSGADDALDLTYPKLAEGLAKARVEQVKTIGADAIICESFTDALSLSNASVHEDDPEVIWLPKLFVKKD